VQATKVNWHYGLRTLESSSNGFTHYG